MGTSDREDAAWQMAWSWVVREHERPLNADERNDLIRWLQADPLHRQNYEEAARVWLLSGLVPSPDD